MSQAAQPAHPEEEEGALGSRQVRRCVFRDPLHRLEEVQELLELRVQEGPHVAVGAEESRPRRELVLVRQGSAEEEQARGLPPLFAACGAPARGAPNLGFGVAREAGTRTRTSAK